MVKLETVSCYAEVRGKLAGVREALRIVYDNLPQSQEREMVTSSIEGIEETLEKMLAHNARALADEVIDGDGE